MTELTLPRVGQVVTRALETGQIPGAVVLVSSQGTAVHRDARGVPEPGSSHRLRPDTIMWLASMTKVVCAAALLMLADDGKLDVGDPVSRYIPQFAAPGRVRVLRPGSPPPQPAMPFGPPPDPLPVYDEVPAGREIRIRDLLTHTSGLQSIFRWNPEYRPPVAGETLAAHVPSLARVIRDFQPGSEWAYSNAAGFDVLARVAEVASGLSFDDLLRRRVFDPLDLRDTGFGLGRTDRAAPLDSRFADNPVPAGQGYFSGAAGLWASLTDYLAFAEFLRDGRTRDGRPLLSQEAVRQLTANQVGDLCPGLNGRPESKGIGFGYAVAVVTDAAAAGVPFSAGTFGWDGVATRRFWVDREAGVALVMYVPDQQVQQDIEAAVADDLRVERRPSATKDGGHQ
jgi:CubicO group peptidase (beta-lactamase class C family)